MSMRLILKFEVISYGARLPTPFVWPGFSGSPSNGILIVIRVPSCCLLSTDMLPWSDSTRFLTMCRPSPAPGIKLSACMKGVKRWYLRNSRLIPTPLSATIKLTHRGLTPVLSIIARFTSMYPDTVNRNALLKMLSKMRFQIPGSIREDQL